ncbi:MAG TPA: antibiotic biosynthesis monooxygenase family protein [Ktedonobacterales bacterium]|jgi:heme-degrading monooxygenase HmoA
MFARIVTASVHLGQMDDAIALFRDSIAPAAQQQKGFKGIRLFTDPTAGKVVVVSLWESEEDLKAGEASGYYQEQINKIAPMLSAPPEREAFEVSVYI